MPLKLPIAAFCLVLTLTGCAVFKSPEPGEPGALGGPLTPPPAAGDNVSIKIPAPKVPPELAQEAASAAAASKTSGQKFTYTLDVKSAQAPAVAEQFEKTSRLALMINDPATTTTLEQRLAVSLGEGHDILSSQGYYEGLVQGHLAKAEDGKISVVIRFSPGEQFKVGASRVVISGQLSKADEAPPLPVSLADVGLEPGVPALAENILKAVDLVEEAFHNRGYPKAKVENTRFTVDKDKKELEAVIYINPGDFAKMGNVAPEGEISVDQSYLTALITWKNGQPWNQELVENYLAVLRQSGLFQSVEGGAAKDDGPDGLRPIRLKTVSAPERTVGGLVSYDTDFGLGLTGYWEHRNLTGHGDRLRLDLPLWSDLQEFTASYRYPFFLRPDQDIVARGGLLHQDTDAYKLFSGSVAAGLERRLTRHWTASVMGSLEGGSLEDPGQPNKEFIMYGLPLTATYDRANNLLDPTQGGRLIMATAPYTGTFHSNFNVVRTRFEGQYFQPLGTERFVLASRAVWGSLWGADNSQEVPSSIRFYSGGGGSVRGYDFQSVGPRNDKREPLGGVSQVEVGTEARWRFSETMGLVAFADGGMVYESVSDQLFQNMLWGAGLGFRYYTAIGPVRVDAAVPLDRRSGDSPWQLYISIGQSF